VSSHPWSKEFDHVLRKLDEAERAVMRLEKKMSQQQPVRRVPRHAPLPEPAWAIAITYKDDGTAAVRINHSQPFALTPKLGRLLEILAADTALTPDGMIGWKPVAEVRRAMAAAPGASPLTRGALHQLTCRLRLELGRLGFHPGLIQHNRARQALRFALRPSPYPILTGREAL